MRYYEATYCSTDIVAKRCCEESRSDRGRGSLGLKHVVSLEGMYGKVHVLVMLQLNHTVGSFHRVFLIYIYVVCMLLAC